MHNFKGLSILVAVLALSAIGASGASAANFTWSATGELTGNATATHVFSTNAGQVRCSAAHTKGTLTSTTFAEQHVTTTYSGCTAFGLGGVHITPATFNFTANGQVHILNP